MTQYVVAKNYNKCRKLQKHRYPDLQIKRRIFCHISENIKQGYHSILPSAYSYLPMNISGRVLRYPNYYLSKLKICDGSISRALHISNRTGSEKTLSTLGASMALRKERLMPTLSARASCVRPFFLL